MLADKPAGSSFLTSPTSLPGRVELARLYAPERLFGFLCSCLALLFQWKIPRTANKIEQQICIFRIIGTWKLLFWELSSHLCQFDVKRSFFQASIIYGCFQLDALAANVRCPLQLGAQFHWVTTTAKTARGVDLGSNHWLLQIEMNYIIWFFNLKF